MSEIIIDANWDLFEAAYKGNLGLVELVKFYRIATPEQKARMDEITKDKNISPELFNAFRELVYEVLGVRLLPDQ